MEQSKPKFQDLTPEQVNDLGATKLMGYTLDHIAPSNGKKYTVSGTNPDGYSWMGSIIFDWFHSHDDCWKAEEKIREIPFNYKAEGKDYEPAPKSTEYIKELHRIFAPPQERLDTFLVVHATAAQKCEAMLRAIGEVE